jgi:hypothetical protein
MNVRAYLINGSVVSWEVAEKLFSTLEEDKLKHVPHSTSRAYKLVWGML